ncbi:LOW QUALITY PROTEIN: hypothetical protein Cgig2_032335 [Carnegiea gigantea]|uniref:Aminotransferase-like plant mobile domain-containing protein n=1 Tax=Carnegiea gigantea TaxID=171969 RepID=A0A9Q1Q803_9CARY|nr:LOW QUALITY PROTEIN: hypothetical protein Cgig2_032335 [Carnegiea gigantea]
MVIFMDQTTSGRRYLHIQLSENDVDGEETKLPSCNSITSLCKFDCIGESGHKSWARLLFHGEFSYKPLYWKCLEDILVRCKDKLITFHLFDALYGSLFRYDKCSNPIRVGPNKYHVTKKSDQENQTPHLGIFSSIIDAGARGWVAKGQRTETFLAVFLSCWLCTFILPVRDAGCIRPGTFSIASFMASSVGYCLPPIILTSIYKGLNEISHSSHPDRSGGHFPAHFLYAWLAKTFDMYELVNEASSSPEMVKLSGLGHAKLSKRPKNSLVLEGAFTGIHPSSTDLSRLSWMMAIYGELTLLILSEHYCPDRFSGQFGFHQDVPANLDFNNLPDQETMLRYHHMLTRYGTGSQVLLHGRCNLLDRNTTCAVREWWSRMIISSTCSPIVSDSKRKQSDLFDTSISKNEGKLSSKPKLKIVRPRKLLAPFVPPMEDGSSCIKIPGIDVVILVTPILAISIESIASLP